MSKAPHISLDHRLKRLKFLAWHRGTKEADLILGTFVDQNLETFSEEDCTFLEALLQEADQDILDWITGKRETPEAFALPLMARLKTLAHMRT